MFSNDCDMLTNLGDIELSRDVMSSNFCRVGSLNPNLVPTNENEVILFYDNILKHSPCVLSLLSS